jgi:hypothetical protein
MKEQCPRTNDGHRMTRWVDAYLLESMEERLKANPEIMQERTQLVEHPCGTSKHANDQRYFLVKGLPRTFELNSASRAWQTSSSECSTSLESPNCWLPSAREGSYSTCALGREQDAGIAVAHTENFYMNTRDLIPLHRRCR